MTATSEQQLDGEALFLQWVEEESHRREIVRLEQYSSQLEFLQLASCCLMFFWIVVMFVGYRSSEELIPAELAGIVTVFVLFGGGLIVWHLERLKQETKRRVESEKNGLNLKE